MPLLLLPPTGGGGGDGGGEVVVPQDIPLDAPFFDGLQRPRIQVLAGFGGTLDPGPGYLHLGVGPGLGTALLGGPGVGVNEVDITSDVRSVSLSQRGPTSDIDAADPVTAIITVNNFRGDYDPQNPASPYNTGSTASLFTATGSDTSPTVNYSVSGQTSPSSSGCTNSVVYVVSHTNLVPNPTLEVNTTGWWAGSGTTIGRSTSQSDTGTASLTLTSGGPGTVYANTNAPDLAQGAAFGSGAIGGGQTITATAMF